LLLLIDELLEVRATADEIAIDPLQRAAALGRDEEPVEAVEEFVADRARYGPVIGKRLISGEDLLDDDVDTADIRMPPGLCLQVAQVPVRIEESIRMIHPQAGHLPLPDESENQPVGLLEYLPALDADPGEIVDVE